MRVGEMRASDAHEQAPGHVAQHHSESGDPIQQHNPSAKQPTAREHMPRV
jgi:hypothetical protein